MKYGKYILILFIVIFIGSNRVFAEGSSHSSGRLGDDNGEVVFKNGVLDCYYISNELAAKVEVSFKDYNVTKMTTYLDRRSVNMIEAYRKQPIENLTSSKTVSMVFDGGNYNTVVETYSIPQYDGNSCPKYVIFYDNGTRIDGFHTYVTNNENVALEMHATLDHLPTPNKVRVYYAPFKTLDEEQYKQEFMNVFQYDDEILEGDKICNLDDSGCTLADICDALLGGGMKEFLDQILGYVRIIVPILIILLGSFDLAKAVLAGKEDGMRKAQKTFVKRIIAGVIVFFVPAIVDVVMWLASMVWDYTTCSL